MRPRQPGTETDHVHDRRGRAGGVHQHAGVGDLAAGFEVERRPFQDDVAAGTRRQAVDEGHRVVEQGRNRRGRAVHRAVAEELVGPLRQRVAGLGRQFRPAPAVEGTLRAGLLLLLPELPIEALGVEAQSVRWRRDPR